MINTNYFCEYCGDFIRVEWHHPISEHPEVGLYLCQRCHSLLYGRKVRYNEREDLDRKRKGIIALVNRVVRRAGYSPKFDIDKR